MFSFKALSLIAASILVGTTYAFDAHFKELIQDPEAIDEFFEEQDTDELISFFQAEPEAFDQLVGKNRPLYDLDNLTEVDVRHLQSNSYSQPSWWTTYREIFGRHFKRCKFQNNVAPASGTKCRRMKIGDYTCMFGSQTCADGSVHPDTLCNCLGSDRMWDCSPYSACDSVAVTTCPELHPATQTTFPACVAPLSCPYGEESCCGTTHPKYVCDCMDGQFDCKDVRACPKNVICPDVGLTSCPMDIPELASNDPNFGAVIPCDFADTNEVCEYGEICCCNDCISETTCTCFENQLECVSVAFGCLGPCPPAIDQQTCAVAGSEETFGEFFCCSDIPEPNWRCTCSDDLVWHCVLENSPFGICDCIDPVITTCPDTLPTMIGSAVCTFQDDLSCEYGEICCCGSFCTVLTCNCINNQFLCLTIEIYCPENCPPDIAGTTCAVAGAEQDFGGDCCAVMPLPYWRCTCSDALIWDCVEEPPDICECVGLTTCPEIVPEMPFGLACDFIDATETCEYGEICCCNDCITETTCECIDNELQCGTLAFGCLGPCAPDIDGQACAVPGAEQTFGEWFCCDPEPLPNWRCTCSDGLTWGCVLENSPFDICDCPIEPILTTCPAENPQIAFTDEIACNFADETETCAYGQVCCCNNCSPETTCNCVDGKLVCGTIAILCQLPCPPATDGQVCAVAGAEEEFGEWSCCGNPPEPNWRCTCTDELIWNCVLENSPFTICVCAAPTAPLPGLPGP